MDAIVREFIAFSNRVKKLLESLQYDLHQILDAIQEQTRAARDAYASHQTQENREPTPIKVIEGIETRKSSADKKDDGDYQNRTIFWQKVTFWVVFGYAAIAFLQWRAYLESNKTNRDAVDLTRKQVYIGQRAYLIPEGFSLAEPLRANNPVRVLFTIRNTGETPALHVQRAGGLLILDQNFPPEIHGAVNPLAPGSVSFVGKGQAPIKPDELWLEGNKKRTLQSAELQAILDGTKHMFALSLVDYRDIFGYRCSTTSCGQYDPGTGEMVRCASQNELKCEGDAK
jgi:hypothetical protein